MGVPSGGRKVLRACFNVSLLQLDFAPGFFVISSGTFVLGAAEWVLGVHCPIMIVRLGPYPTMSYSSIIEVNINVFCRL
jgi:hypothetical protein